MRKTMRPMPRVVPPRSVSQYQRGRRAPSSTTAPVVMTTGKAAIPMSGLGKPSSEPCQESIASPQSSSALRLHDGTWFGSASLRYFSIASAAEPNRPITPSTTSSQPVVRAVIGRGPGAGSSSSSGSADTFAPAVALLLTGALLVGHRLAPDVTARTAVRAGHNLPRLAGSGLGAGLSSPPNTGFLSLSRRYRQQPRARRRGRPCSTPRVGPAGAGSAGAEWFYRGAPDSAGAGASSVRVATTTPAGRRPTSRMMPSPATVSTTPVQAGAR